MTRAVDPSRPAAVWITSFIDYAGLFPPAALDLEGAAAEYARSRRGPDAWMMGRFVVPAARLGELGALITRVDPNGLPWRLSVLVGPDLDADLAQVRACHGAMAVEALEARAETTQAIDRIAAMDIAIDTYVEIPFQSPADDLLERLVKHGLRAKIRTGGITREAFPALEELASFLGSAVRAGVSFKATAGLHHPLRGEYRLTNDSDSERATMHGYLNLLLATAGVRIGLSGMQLERLLIARDPSAFTFDEGGVGWSGHWFSADTLDETRMRGLVGIGSCSFREPVDELRALMAQTR